MSISIFNYTYLKNFSSYIFCIPYWKVSKISIGTQTTIKNLPTILAAACLALSVSLVGGTIAGYFYLKSPTTQEKIKQALIEQVGPLVESQIKGALPGLGGSPSGGTSSFLSIPSTTGGVLPINK